MGLEFKLHVLGISESWLNEVIPDNFIQISGYELVRLDRSWKHPVSNTVKKGGGVCLYVRDILQWNDENFSFLNKSENYIENQWIEITNNFSKNFIIVNIYRPPDGNIKEFKDYIEAALSSLDLTKFDVFLMGDFNLDYIDNKLPGVKDLKLLFKQHGFSQFIKSPTRYSAVKNACLDLICSNSDHIMNAQVCDVNISDHEMVIISRRHIKVKQKKRLL